jgi:hypothetical protein
MRFDSCSPICSLHPRAGSGSKSDPPARGWDVIEIIKAIRTYEITLSVFKLSRFGLLDARKSSQIQLTKSLDMTDAR